MIFLRKSFTWNNFVFVSIDEIIEKIKEAGFKIALQKVIQLTKAEAEEFYNEHKEQEYFEELTEQMSRWDKLEREVTRF